MSRMNAQATPLFRKILPAAILVACCLTTFVTHCDAQGFRLFRRNQQQQPKVAYHLDENSGPWLIMCASFDGMHGKQDAARLAEELSTKFKNVYVYHRQVDLGKKLANKGRGFAKPKAGGKENVPAREMKPVNGSQVRDEYAVLIGDFAKIDDASAQRALAEVKRLQPQSLQHLAQGNEDSTLASARMRAQSDAIFGTENSNGWKAMNNQSIQAGQPLKFAFLMANPLLSETYFSSQRIDPYIIKINTGLPNSLLNNKKKYSVKVASFSGKTIVKKNDIDRLRNARPSDSLMKAEQRASILASYLRKKGFEAYEFHDRYESYVCVGGFDWVSKEVGGVKQPNPEVEKIVRTFRGRSTANGVVFHGYKLPGKLLSAGITCDSNPVTVTVPKAPQRRAGIRGMFR